MTWKQIIIEANNILYDIPPGKEGKGIGGHLAYQVEMLEAIKIHRRITWAFQYSEKSEGEKELLALKELIEKNKH